jgi:pyrimidine operon attenuation protein / uracil phosphoribosyltransferase
MAPAPNLPDAELLLAELAARMLPHITQSTGLIGVHTGGVWLARRLHRELGVKVPLGSLDITFYRDDFGKIGLHPIAKPSNIPFEVEGRDIVLVDDVLYTGRTIRAAMNELFDFGRPASIKLAALVDRQQRELPICAQFVGTTLAVPQNQMLILEQNENGTLAFKLQEKTIR